LPRNIVDDEPVSDGRTLTHVNLSRIFVVSVIVTLIGTRAPDSGAANWQRLGLILLCCLLVYRGYRWALWLLGVLAVLAGGFMVVLAFGMSGMHWTDRILFGVPGALQVAAFFVLIKAPQVRAFMAAQRAGRRPAPPMPEE
jgi:hypothetical protein